VLTRLRFDRSSSLRAPQEQADGTVIYEAVLSRAGVLAYRNDDGSMRYEHRPSKEVFAPASMKSFEGMAVTDYHPNGIPVDAQNRTELNRGYIVPGSLRRDNNELIGSIHVTDANLIRAIRAGRTAVSLGYFQDTIRQDGVAPEDGKPHTHVQTNIVGNHVAIVDIGRAGDNARLRADSITHSIESEIVMDELKKALTDLLAANTELNKVKLRLDALESENTTIKKTLATVEADRDTAVDKLAKSEKLRTDGEKNALENARARVRLEDTAKRVLTVDGESPDLSKLTDRQIQEKVIVQLTGKDVPSGKSPEYISARFDGLVEDLPEKTDREDKAIAVVRKAVDTSGKLRSDSGKKSSSDYRQDMIDQQNNAWKQKPQQKN
jgi:hypothetical protein